MYTLGSSLAPSKVEGIAPTRIGEAQPGSQTPGNNGQGKGTKSAASRNGRVPGGLVCDWRPRGLEMDPRLEKRGERETSQSAASFKK